jgi:fluoroacetyl-CoA thioesterase
MRQVEIGATGNRDLVVAAEHLAGAVVATLPQVMSTPTMVALMEQAAIAALAPCIEDGETSVGTSISVEHMAATPIGHRVRAEAEVTKVDGRRIEFRVAAFDESEQIGRGVHNRAVIQLAKFTERLKSKMKS